MSFVALSEEGRAIASLSSLWLTLIFRRPEIEERGKHTYLVFYPFALEEIVDVEVEVRSIALLRF